MTGDWLEKLLEPASVAIIGASDDIKAPGGRVMRFMLSYGYRGKIWPVNPKRAEVQGVKAYASVRELPGVPELAAVLVPASAALEALEDCAALGVPIAVVGSAGFSESGPQGVELQARLADIAARTGLRLIGPNTNGVINCRSGLTATFTPALDQDEFRIADGPVAIVSQSGAIGGALFYDAQRSGLPVGRLINTGNELDISLEMALEALLEPDMGTGTILCYSEGLRKPEVFIRAARRARELGKRIALLKTGTSQSGAKAAAAHTASLAGEDRVYDGVLHQLGVARARGMTHLLDVGRVMAARPEPLGRRASIVSMSGGVGIMLTDALETAGLRLATLSDQMKQALDPLLPPFLGRNNPLDVGGAPFHDLERLGRILQILEANADSDFTVVAVGSFERRQLEIADALLEAWRRLSKPLFVVWFGGGDLATARLNRAGVPTFPDARRLVEAVSAAVERPCGASLPAAPTASGAAAAANAVIVRARAAGLNIIDEVDGKRILAAYGLDVVREQVVARESDCEAALEPLRLPVVAKLLSSELVHKARVGGVRLGLQSPQAVREAVRELIALAGQLELADAKVVLQEQIEPGVELLLGMKRDPTFGPVITLGVGGAFAEAWDDVQVRLPDAGLDVADMLALLRYRGLIEPAMIAPSVAGFCELVRELGDELDAIDINPLIVDPRQGRAVVVDTVFFLRAGS
jgi:acyl-CoA synthetase (NDP forming)